MNLQTLMLWIELLSDHQDITVIQVVHRLQNTRPVDYTPTQKRTQNQTQTWMHKHTLLQLDYLGSHHADQHVSTVSGPSSTCAEWHTVTLGYSAGDAQLLEGCHAHGSTQVGGRPDELI